MELLDAFASRQGHREINATKWRTTEPHRCAGEPRVKAFPHQVKRVGPITTVGHTDGSYWLPLATRS